MYHSSVQEMQSRANGMEQEIEEELFNLRREFENAYTIGDCHLRGYHVFLTYFHQNQINMCHPFLVSPYEYLSLDGDQSNYDFFASSKYPAADDCQETHEVEMINIY